VRREGLSRHLFFVSAMQFDEGEMLLANSSDQRRKTVLKAVGILLVCVFFVGGYVVSDGQEDDQDQLSELATWRNPFAFGDNDGLATLTSLSQANATSFNSSANSTQNKTTVVYMTRPPTKPTMIPTHSPTKAPPPISVKILCIPLPGQNISTYLGEMIMKLNENATHPLTFNGFEMQSATNNMAISGGGDNGTVTVVAPKGKPAHVAAEFHVIRKRPQGEGMVDKELTVTAKGLPTKKGAKKPKAKKGCGWKCDDNLAMVTDQGQKMYWCPTSAPTGVPTPSPTPIPTFTYAPTVYGAVKVPGGTHWAFSPNLYKFIGKEVNSKSAHVLKPQPKAQEAELAGK